MPHVPGAQLRAYRPGALSQNDQRHTRDAAGAPGPWAPDLEPAGNQGDKLLLFLKKENLFIFGCVGSSLLRAGFL